MLVPAKDQLPDQRLRRELRQTIERSTYCIALVDLWTLRVLELNRAAKGALDVAWPRDDLHVSTFAPNPRHSRAVARLMVDGVIDSFQGTRLLRRASGGRFPARIWMSVVPSGGERRFALILASPLDGEDGTIGHSALLDELPLGRTPTPVTVGAVDEDWCIDRMSSDVTGLLGGAHTDWLGMPFLGTVHPGDANELLTAVARVRATGSGCGLCVRLRAIEGTWTPVRVLIVPRSGGGNGFGFALLAADADEVSQRTGRAHALEQHLWRIAEEVGAAGVLDALAQAPDPTANPRLADLSTRQLEIVTRLLRGERVPQIAAAMFLSASTVRNHLSVVYRKMGVHSQAALLAALRSDTSSKDA